MRAKILIPFGGVVVFVAIMIIFLGQQSTTSQQPYYYNNDTVISLERTGCIDSCPSYYVVIYENGTVIFEGLKFVENIGVMEYSISPRDVDRLVDKFSDVGYFAFDDRYEPTGVVVSDEPSVITSFKNKSYEKTIVNHASSGPAALQELENMIEKIAKTSSVIDKSIATQSPKVASIYNMEPNSSEIFYYPNPEKTENRDVFQKFLLIRLPAHLGGTVNDASAFRAYSAVSLTDHCLVKYWPQEGRQRMENPCRGGMYRAIDGVLMVGVDPIKITSPVALPQLELSIENELLYINPPVWSLRENGVIGVGREVPLSDIRQNSEIIASSLKTLNPHYPQIPAEFTGFILAEISHNHDIEARYFDFASMSENLTIRIKNTSAYDQQHFLNLAKPNSEFWQIGDSVIKISGSALDDNSSLPQRHKTYNVKFIDDGFMFEIVGKNIEFIKKEIVKHYFPEYENENMFLVSKNN